MRMSALDAHGAGDLLDGHLQHERPGAGAAELLVEGQPEQVLLAKSLRMSHGYSPFSSISAARGADALGDDLADRVPEVQVLLGHRVHVARRLHVRLMVMAPPQG
jgi:hypothetical protein